MYNVAVAWFAANYRSLWEWADSAPFLEHLEPQAPKPGELEEEEAGGDPGQVQHGVQQLFKATKNIKINEKSTNLFLLFLCIWARSTAPI